MADPNKRTQLNRALSKLGYCSRTVADAWIQSGIVLVNGKTVRDSQTWVNLGTDQIVAQGKKNPVALHRSHVYLAVHKPKDVVTTRSDELGRKTIYDLLPPQWNSEWLFPVGRLDKDSEGLILMTDDGEFANLLTDPEFHIEKTYRVKLSANPTESELEILRQGMDIAGHKTRPCLIELENSGHWLKVKLTEGRNRQIRKMFHELGYKVKQLHRITMGSLPLGNLKPGECRLLTPKEVKTLSLEAKTLH